MKKYLLFAIGLISASLGATTATEEAIILNQELQFLEDSVNQIQSTSISVSDESQKNRALNTPSLERTYFGEDTEEDRISTKTSGPKRRSL